MKVQTNYGYIPKVNSVANKNPAFKSVAAFYKPRSYRQVRDLANSVFEHSEGAQKLLLRLYKLRGENLNNAITAFGTAAVAPWFIRYNPFSREDADSKAYSAWRQPISAVITWSGQVLLMSRYNDMLDRHAAQLGIDSMDLKAKPPESVLKPIVKLEYDNYKASQIAKGLECESRNKWMDDRILAIQDQAYYDELDRLRATVDADKIALKDIIRPSELNDKKDKLFKKVLMEKHGFSENELKPFEKYNDFYKKGKSLLKERQLDFNFIHNSINDVAEDECIDDLKRLLDQETKIKLQTSLLKNKMQEEFAVKEKEIMRAHSTTPTAGKIPSVSVAIEKELNEASAQIFDKHLSELKDACEQINSKTSLTDEEKNTLEALKKQSDKINAKTALTPEDKNILSEISAKCEKINAKQALTEEENVTLAVYEKLTHQGSIEGIKYHGDTQEQVLKSIKIKKWLNTRINLAETKLKTWKDRSGILVGLGILCITCPILNWAYPKIMKKCFPRLSEAKEAKKAELLEARKAELAAEEEKAKEVK